MITRGQHERGKYAAAVAADIYRSLSREIVRTDRNLAAETEFKLKPRTTKPPVTAADDEDDDDSAAASTNSANTGTGVNDLNNLLLNNNQKVIVVPSAPKAADKKLINRTGDSKPVYQPVEQPKPGVKTPEYKPAQPANQQKKGDQKPMFPPVVITYDKNPGDTDNP